MNQKEILQLIYDLDLADRLELFSNLKEEFCAHCGQATYAKLCDCNNES